MKRLLSVFFVIVLGFCYNSNAMEGASSADECKVIEVSRARPLRNKYVFFEYALCPSVARQKIRCYLLCELQTRKKVGSCVIAQDFLCNSCDCPDVELRAFNVDPKENCDQILLDNLLEHARYAGYERIYFRTFGSHSESEINRIKLFKAAGIDVIES